MTAKRINLVNWANFVVLLFLFALCLIIYTLSDLFFQHEMNVKREKVNAENRKLALSLAENVHARFSEADIILDIMKRELEGQGYLNREQRELLMSFHQRGMINQIAAADANGDLFFSALPLTRQTNIADREGYLAHRKSNTGGLFISGPVSTSKGSIFLSRRVNDATGGFAGIVAVGVTPNYLTALFRQVDLGPNNEIVLLRSDGTLLACYPENNAASTPAFRYPVAFAHMNQGVASGSFESVEPGETPQIGAFQTLEDYPATILVSLSKETALADIKARHNTYKYWITTFSLLLMLGCVALYRQLQDRLRTEHALRASKQELQLLLDSTGEAIYGVDLDGNCSFSNMQCARLLGYDHPRSLVKKHIVAHFNDLRIDDTPSVVKNVDIVKTLKPGEGLHIDNELIRKLDGSMFPVECRVYPQWRDGEIIGGVVIFVDVTSRKQFEEQLQESNLRLIILNEIYRKVTKKLAVDALIRETISALKGQLHADGIGFYIFDDQLIVEQSSYGLSKDFACYLQEGVSGRLMGLAVLTGEPYTLKTTALFKGGFKDACLREQITDIGYYPLMSEGQAIAAIGIYNRHDRYIHDNDHELVTAVSNQLAAVLRNVQLFISLKNELEERKRTQIRLQEAKEEAERANAAKSQFLANMSHEIRTPMNGIIGMTDLTLMTELTEEQREYLETVKSSTRALLRVVNDILDYSKVEAGVVVLENSPFALREVVSEVVALFSIAAKHKNMHISTDIDPSIPETIYGDSVRLRQVLSNLIGNAVKFTCNGSIDVSVTCEQLSGSAITLKFAVADSGIGIAEKNLDRLFKSFSQVDSSNTRQFGGTGLGLVISQKLVNLMNGTIWLESEEGVGSTFFFTAVLGVNSIVEVDRERQRLSRLSARKKIMLVEDDEVSRKIILSLLEKRGIDVSWDKNGQEVLKLTEQEDFDLILMDISLPYIDGYTITSLLRAREITAEIPIIAVTAHALPGEKERCLLAGMSDYVSKPIDIGELSTLIDKWLRRDVV